MYFHKPRIKLQVKTYKNENPQKKFSDSRPKILFLIFSTKTIVVGTNQSCVHKKPTMKFQIKITENRDICNILTFFSWWRRQRRRSRERERERERDSERECRGLK